MVIRGPGFINGTIILDEPEAVYYSGQLMSGNLHFELKEPLSFTAINLVYVGEAVVQWSETQKEMSGGVERYRDVKYEGREQYFNFVQCLDGGTGVSTLPAGVHSIPFQFQIPSNTPSSFREEEGGISYSVTAYLEYPQPGKREHLKKEFRVVAPIHVNALENMKQPLELDFEEIETCHCFCQNQPIILKIKLPSGVFNLGSSIPVTVKAKNNSSVEIYEILFKITRRYTYRTQRPRSEYEAPEQNLVEVKKGPIMGNTTRDYCWDIKLPDEVQPNLENCNIMDVAYYFKVKIRMTGCNEDVEDETEIFIGLLPFSDLSNVPSCLAQDLPRAPIPNPNNPPVFGLNVTPGPNNLPIPSPNLSKHPSQENVPLQASTNFSTAPGLNNSQVPSYGFRVQNTPISPPYPHNVATNTGYPQPAIPMAPMGNPPYPIAPMGNNVLNLSQTNVNTVVPSAPPL